MSVRRSLAPLVLLFAFAPAALADQASKPWDPTRTSAPGDTTELKQLQTTVKAVVEKVTPATVAVVLTSREGFSVGSGVIVTPDGLVMTASHVVDPPPGVKWDVTGQKVALILSDGSRVDAEALGRNPGADSGLIKITGKVPKDAKWPGAKDGKWPFAPIGKSDGVKPGQWVISLGHPGGPRLSDDEKNPTLVRRPPVRLGQIIGTKSQPSFLAGRPFRFLVSDCTLVGGDSGGPLFDLTGKVIGIHSQIGEKLAENLHVPADTYTTEWDKMVALEVIGAPLGAALGVVLPEDRKEKPVVETVREGSPAEAAGIKAEDLLLKVDGKATPTAADVTAVLDKLKPGTVIPVEVKRGDETIEVKVKVAARGGIGGRSRERPRRTEPAENEDSIKKSPEKAKPADEKPAEKKPTGPNAPIEKKPGEKTPDKPVEKKNGQDKP